MESFGMPVLKQRDPANHRLAVRLPQVVRTTCLAVLPCPNGSGGKWNRLSYYPGADGDLAAHREGRGNGALTLPD
jgi:hypothetical protein